MAEPKFRDRESFGELVTEGTRVSVLWPNGAGIDVFEASCYGGFRCVASYEVYNDGRYGLVRQNYAPNATDDPDFARVANHS